jgi:glycosyltransferase involved in cell wall biosynthesis
MLRILFITPNPPTPPTSAASQRSNLIFRALHGIGAVDTLLLSYPERITPDQMQRLREEFHLVGCVGTRIRAEHGAWRFLRPFCPALVDDLAKHWGACEQEYSPQPAAVAELERCLARAPYDVVVTRYLRAASRTGATSLTPLVLDVDDLDTQVCSSELDAPYQSHWRVGLIKRRLRRLQPVVQRWLSLADYLWVSNPTDRQVPGLERAHWLPNIPFAVIDNATTPARPAPGCHTVMTIGTWDYPPNVKGTDYFVREIWPSVHAVEPDAKLWIAGRGLSRPLQHRWGRVSGVEPVGFIEDLTGAYAACAFTVAPIYEGGGTHVKVLESLYFGRLPVVTRYALRGYEDSLRHGESIYVAASRDEMIRGCLDLLRNPLAVAGMAEQGRAIVKQEYSFDRIRRVVEETMHEALQHGPVRKR